MSAKKNRQTFMAIDTDTDDVIGVGDRKTVTDLIKDHCEIHSLDENEVNDYIKLYEVFEKPLSVDVTKVFEITF